MTSATRLVAAAAVLAITGAAAGLPPIRVRPLIVEGDEIAGVGFVTTVNDVVVNNRGEWIAVVDTNNADTNRDEVMVKNGAMILRERDPIASGGTGIGRVLFFFNAPTLNNNGDSVFHFTNIDTSVTPTDVESGMYFNLTPAAYEDDPTTLPPGGATFTTFADGKINDSNQVLSRFTYISASQSTFALFQLDAAGAITASTLIATVGDPAPGTAQFFTGFQVTETQNAFNNAGDYIFQGVIDGDVNFNNLYYKNAAIIAQQGMPSTVAGRNWAEMNSTFTAVDMNNSGDWVLRGTLAGDTASDNVIVKNGVTFVQEGDMVAAIGAAATTFAGGSGPVRIDDSGRVIWFVDTNLADTTIDTAIMRDMEVLVRERVTVVTPPPFGEVVSSFGTGPGWLNVSDNGQHVIFIANLLATVPPRPNTAGTVSGAFLVTICPADVNGSGTVTVQDIFDFLALYFVNDLRADYNLSGAISVQDIFDYLVDYFAGCG